MEKRYAVILALLSTFLILNIYLLFSYLNLEDPQLVFISRVIDGDTVELDNGLIVRIANINAPEKNQFNSEFSKKYLESFINQSLQIENLGFDKYQRTLARIYSPKYINLDIVELGYASKFLVQNEEKEIFEKAEKEAIENEKGIWKRSKYYGCFSTHIDKKNEIIDFTNNCSPMSIKNWFVKDEGRTIYLFPDISPALFKLYTKSGNNSWTELFWNSKKEIWNDDSDSLYLFDNEGKLVHYDTYS